MPKIGPQNNFLVLLFSTKALKVIVFNIMLLGL